MTGRFSIRLQTIKNLSAPVILARSLKRLGIRGAALDRLDFLHAPDASKPTKAPDILFGAMAEVGLPRDPVLRAMEGGTVLEVGCGRHIGFAALSATMGAKTYVGADPSVDETLLRHPSVVNRVLEPFLTATAAYVSRPPISASELLTRCRLEKSGVADAVSETDTLDVCLSISCLEHIDDLDLAARKLASSSHADTLHVHLINFSNHLSKSRPFDHLYELEPTPFKKEWGGIVNGLRPSDFVSRFQDVGLDLSFAPLDRVPTDAMPGTIAPYWLERYEPDELAVRTGLLFSPRLGDYSK